MRALTAVRSMLPRLGRDGVKKPSVEAIEMSMYESFKAQATALNKISFHKGHYLFEISHLIKSEGIRIAPVPKDGSLREIDSISAILKHDVDRFLNEIDSPGHDTDKFGSDEQQKAIVCETRFRVTFLGHYLESLRNAIRDEKIPRSFVNYERLVDVILLGTASERISEHVSMYGNILDQYQLQSSFYSLYEPELQTCVELIKSNPGMTKKVLKDLPKYWNTYLLDNLVLNTKSRSIFCWSVPEYSGFTPVDDHVLVTTEVLLKSRREFFEEGDTIGQGFIKDYMEKRMEYYKERTSLKTTLYQGIAFFFVVSFLDVYITNM